MDKRTRVVNTARSWFCGLVAVLDCSSKCWKSIVSRGTQVLLSCSGASNKDPVDAKLFGLGWNTNGLGDQVTGPSAAQTSE